MKKSLWVQNQNLKNDNKIDIKILNDITTDKVT